MLESQAGEMKKKKKGKKEKREPCDLDIDGMKKLRSYYVIMN